MRTSGIEPAEGPADSIPRTVMQGTVRCRRSILPGFEVVEMTVNVIHPADLGRTGAYRYRVRRRRRPRATPSRLPGLVPTSPTPG
jgi:hypothetical protein